MIAGSQSRWIKQQDAFCVVDGLSINATNEYGAVDGAGKASLLRSFTNNRAELKSAVSQSFDFIADGFGDGVNCLRHVIVSGNVVSFLNTNKIMNANWDSKVWFAAKIKFSSTGSNRTLFSTGFSEETATHLTFGTHQGKLFMEVKLNGFSRRVISALSVNNNQVRDVVFYWDGINLSSCKFIIDGVEDTTVVVNSDDMTGLQMECNSTIVGGLITGGLLYLGDLGNFGYGFGLPNIKSIKRNILI